MEFTTPLRLHSQAIRLDAEATPSPPARKRRSHDGPFTLEGREPRSRGLEGATRRSTSRPPRYATLPAAVTRSEEHTSELQSLRHLVCRLLLEKKKKTKHTATHRHPNIIR